MKKLVSFALIASLLLLGSLLLAPVFAAPPPITNPMTITEATIEGGNVATVDPAACYDTASGEIIMNVYDTLVFFDGEHMETYIPALATSWTITELAPGATSPHGLPWHWRYDFTIRGGVYFQGGQLLVPQDVEFSFEREMAMDYAGGPQWMFFEPLLNGAATSYINGLDFDIVGSALDRQHVGEYIDDSVQVSGNVVSLYLSFDGSYAPLMQILSQPWAAIMSKAAVVASGRGWNGDWGVDHTGYYAYYNPTTPPMDEEPYIMNGCGPFAYYTLDQTVGYWELHRFNGYWRGWPATFPTLAGASPAGYVNTFISTWQYVWETRKTMFLDGDVDFCAVPRMHIAEIMGANPPTTQANGVRQIHPLPSFACDALFFTFNIATTSTFGTFYPNGVYNELGIPYDFFSNVNVRKGFASIFDYNTFLAVAYLNEAMQPATAIIPGLPYYDASIPKWTYDLTAASNYFHAAPGLWDTGFTIKVFYNSGNLPRQTAANLVQAGINALGNPKFHVEVVAMTWSTILTGIRRHQVPIFLIGWLADYPDPHNFVYAFYYTYGAFSYYQGYSNDAMDALIDQGIRTPDGPARAAIYHDIQMMVKDDCPSTSLDQAIGRHFERDWIAGWYYNPIYSGNFAYNLWKWYYTPHAQLDTSVQTTSNLLPADVNYDGKVDMKDIGTTARSFGSYFGPPIHPRWVYRCDFNNDRKVDMKDIGQVARNFGKTSAVWTTPP